MMKFVQENEYKIVVPLFGAAYAYVRLKSLSTVLSHTENGRIQGLFKAFE